MFKLTMNLFWSLCLLLAGISGPVFSQGANYELVDTGVLVHPTHGRGIEMRIQPGEMPPNEVLEEVGIRICRHYAPSVIPYVIKNTDITDPDFIAVRIISGGMFGRYFLQTFAIEGDTCGGEL